MDIKSLQNLKRINNTTYELYVEVIVGDAKFGVFPFTVQDRHAMRIDNICQDIYNNTNHVDVLMTINGIFNSYTIDIGDTIFFLEEKDIDNVRSNEAATTAIVDAIKNANKGKQQKSDSSRTKDKANSKETEKQKLASAAANANVAVPPNIAQTNNASIDFKEGVIKLKPNF